MPTAPPPGFQGYAPVGGYGQPPGVPAKKSKAGLVAGLSLLGVVAVIIALLVAGARYERSRYSPTKGVEAAFTALRSGSVSAVNSDTVEPVGYDSALTSDAVLKQADDGSHPLRDVRVSGVVTHGGSGTAVVDYDLGSVHQRVTLTIARDSSHKHLGLFAAWKPVSLSGLLIADGSAQGLTHSTAYGELVSSSGSEALPGWYDVSFTDESGVLVGGSAGGALQPERSLTVTPSGPATVTPKATRTVLSGLQEALATCASQTFADNIDCPFSVPAADQDDASDATYTITGDPTGNAKVTGYDASTSMITMAGTLSVTVTWMRLDEDTGDESPASAKLTSPYTASVGVTPDGPDTFYTFAVPTS